MTAILVSIAYSGKFSQRSVVNLYLNELISTYRIRTYRCERREGFLHTQPMKTSFLDSSFEVDFGLQRAK